jgi:hypothetical protein
MGLEVGLPATGVVLPIWDRSKNRQMGFPGRDRSKVSRSSVLVCVGPQLKINFNINTTTKFSKK